MEPNKVISTHYVFQYTPSGNYLMHFSILSNKTIIACENCIDGVERLLSYSFSRFENVHKINLSEYKNL